MDIFHAIFPADPVNILYLAHRIPFPPTKGDKLRVFRHLERLRRRHKVWCACFVDDPGDFRWVGPLRAYCQDLIAIPLNRRIALARGAWGLLKGGTLTEAFYLDPRMHRALRDWERVIQFDVAIAFSSSMVQYARQVSASRRVLDLCDSDAGKWLDYSTRSPFYSRWAYRRESMRLGELERATPSRFDEVLVISESEKRALCGAGESQHVHVVTNGVQLPDLPEPASAASAIGDACPYRPPVVGFLGVMDYPPNVDAVTWFARRGWPAIAERYPRAEFRVAGRNPTGVVRRLARIPGITVVGEIDDVWSEIAQWDVVIAPLRIARGLQNKVLEGMAAAKPVVLTSKAADGINARDGMEFLIADTIDQMRERVFSLLDNPMLRNQIGKAARQYVAQHHKWDTVLDQMEWLITGAKERSIATIEVVPTRKADEVLAANISPSVSSMDSPPIPSFSAQD